MAENNSLEGQFQSTLGRAPTEDELAFFNRFITEGSLQPHEIGQILQGTPEFQRTQLNQNTNALDSRLQASDNQALQYGADVAGAKAQSRFAGLGRPNSSALAASVFGQTGQMANNLAQQRQSALASFYGNGLQKNMNAYGDQAQTPLARGYGLRDETRQRNYQIEDYYRQSNDEGNAQHGIDNTFGSPLLGRTANGLFNLGAAYLGGKSGQQKQSATPVQPGGPK